MGELSGDRNSGHVDAVVAYKLHSDDAYALRSGACAVCDAVDYDGSSYGCGVVMSCGAHSGPSRDYRHD
ncbi:Uncharacterised protein [Zhongshania aliphaticivorans]|uniref:Uncharacterized protein n=1 Tax=Zhongshania aliphaticivorans TaxID=1470434 RepID=A0A5S9QNF8_9GAMM|nr:hypothetical protein [Zhongshania aliphaticivorans]CAA0087617.1 Uncharacterised protein [Zhongshania aliphaticivorans]CAA0115216.1 Uncharacterised protein [Zhongshania aliphaticivorans]CAA0120064.1 Uncharacterised protein [Zhongshania aliphaticivorans]